MLSFCLSLEIYNYKLKKNILEFNNTDNDEIDFNNENNNVTHHYNINMAEDHIEELYIYNQTDILSSNVYNPTVTTLENQIKLKKLLLVFQNFLTSREIPHALIFGSLLSAIRNKILILPWDDDIDIVIPQYVRYKPAPNQTKFTLYKRNSHIKDILVDGLYRRHNYDFYDKDNRYISLSNIYIY